MAVILLLGTKNTHKTAELAEILAGLPWEVRSLAAAPAHPQRDEAGATIEQQSHLKASDY